MDKALQKVRFFAIALNVALLVGIIYKIAGDPPNDAHGWGVVATAFGYLVLCVIGLTGLFGRLFAAVAAVFTGMAVLVWGGLIALMIVWPMGNKPEGLELAFLAGSWLVLVFTGGVLVYMVGFKAPNSKGSSGNIAEKEN